MYYILVIIIFYILYTRELGFRCEGVILVVRVVGRGASV
jgi:hypothetical protein